MEACYKRDGKCNKQAVLKIDISSDWGAVKYAAFSNVEQQIAASAKLSYPKRIHSMCLFKDASDIYRAAMFSPIPHEQRVKPIEEQDHEPLCFLLGAFKGSETNWSVPEKEGWRSKRMGRHANKTGCATQDSPEREESCKIKTTNAIIYQPQLGWEARLAECQRNYQLSENLKSNSS